MVFLFLHLAVIFQTFSFLFVVVFKSSHFNAEMESELHSFVPLMSAAGSTKRRQLLYLKVSTSDSSHINGQ